VMGFPPAVLEPVELNWIVPPPGAEAHPRSAKIAMIGTKRRNE